ncbi:S2P [Trypoxylus dichotomus]
MEVYSTLLIIAGIYSLLFFLDRFYKTCSHYPYIQFLKGTGLEIKFLHIKWKTTALNRTFLRWGSGHSSFFSVWFQWGTYVAILLLPIATILLIVTIFQTLSRKTSSTIVEAVIPGVNLPTSELDVAKHSPLKGSNGLYPNDKVLQINDCTITNSDSWYECIQKTQINKLGFCVSADIVNMLDETSHVSQISNEEVNCCAAGKLKSICFEYIEHNNGIVEIPPHSCLPIRPIVEKSISFCNTDDQK